MLITENEIPGVILHMAVILIVYKLTLFWISVSDLQILLSPYGLYIVLQIDHHGKQNIISICSCRWYWNNIVFSCVWQEKKIKGLWFRISAEMNRMVFFNMYLRKFVIFIKGLVKRQRITVWSFLFDKSSSETLSIENPLKTPTSRKEIPL